MATVNSLNGLSPEASLAEADVVNICLRAEAVGSRALELVQSHETPSEPEAAILPAMPVRTNRLSQTMDKVEDESQVEFIERLASDIYKLGDTKVLPYELDTFCQIFPNWQHQSAILDSRKYSVFRRSVNDNLDLGTFSESGPERRVISDEHEVVILVKEARTGDLIKITDIEHYVAVRGEAIEADSSNMSLLDKKRLLSESLQNVIKRLFWPPCVIAKDLGIAETTVRNHSGLARAKLGLSTQSQLVVFAIEARLINMDDISSGKTDKLTAEERLFLQNNHSSTYRKASEDLNVSHSTITANWKGVFNKTGAIDRNQATIMAIKDGLLEIVDNKVVVKHQK